MTPKCWSLFILDLSLTSRPVISSWVTNRHHKHSITKIQLLIPLLAHTCSLHNITVFHSSSQHLWSNSWCLRPRVWPMPWNITSSIFKLSSEINYLLSLLLLPPHPFGSSHHFSYEFSQEPPNSSSFHLFPTSFSPDIKAILFKM